MPYFTIQSKLNLLVLLTFLPAFGFLGISLLYLWLHASNAASSLSLDILLRVLLA